MEQTVRVREIYDDATAQVLILRESACSGDCHKCSGCGAAQQALLVRALNPIGAKPGDLVVVQSASKPVLAAAAVLYLLPLVLFFWGYLTGDALCKQGGLVGCLAFLGGIVLAIVYDRRVAAKQKTVYTITGYSGTDVPGTQTKGDNDLD